MSTIYLSMEGQNFPYHFFHITKEILYILEKNTRGNIWLFGGGVYRPLIHLIYKNRRTCADFDFIAEECVSSPQVLSGWQVKKNTLGGFKFFNKSVQIDLWSFAMHQSPKRDTFSWNEKTILQATPLTIQSILYNLQTQQVSGSVGLEAIRKRKVEIHYFPAAESYCRKKGITIQEYQQRKAESIGFSV